MDRLTQYRQVIERVLRQYAAFPPSAGGVEVTTVFDRNSDNYLLIGLGWNGLRRVHSIYGHVRIHEGKIWVEKDGTEKGLAVEFVDAGISKQEIVLAFYEPEHRKVTDFAVA